MALRDYRIPTPLPAPAILAAIDEPPGLPMPGAIAALPPSLIGDDRADVGFLYGLLQGLDTTVSGMLPLTGGTLTGALTINSASGDKLILQKSAVEVASFDANGALDVNLPGDLGVIAQFRHSGVTDMFVSSSGNMHLRGNFGIGPDADAPTHRLLVHEADMKWFFSDDNNPKSGLRGIHIEKRLASDLRPHGISYDIEGVPKWESGVDFDTDNAEGNSDFVPCLDQTAGIIDDGSGANTGADIIRVSAAEQCTTHGQGPKFVMGFKCGTPRAQADCFQFDAGLNLGGIRVSTNNDVTKSSLTLAQRSATHNRLAVTWANANDAGSLWQTGVDLLAAGTSSWSFSFRDEKTTSAKDTRLFIEGTNNLVAKIGFSTLAPQATHHLLFSNAAGDFDTVQSHWCASFEDTGAVGARHNRAINIQSILDAGTVKNFLLLSGGLGAGSTTTTPVFTSTGAGAFGLERTDTELSLVGAGAGTNQTIVRGLRMNTSGQLGFFGSSPSAKPTISGSRGGNAALADLLTKGATLGLWVDGTSA